jgi:hypothetical protein
LKAGRKRSPYRVRRTINLILCRLGNNIKLLQCSIRLSFSSSKQTIIDLANTLHSNSNKIVASRFDHTTLQPSAKNGFPSEEPRPQLMSQINLPTEYYTRRVGFSPQAPPRKGKGIYQSWRRSRRTTPPTPPRQSRRAVFLPWTQWTSYSRRSL